MNLIKWNYQKLANLTRDWTQVACTRVRHVNHYTKVSSVLVWNCKWIPIHAWVNLSISSNSSNWTKNPSFWKKTSLVDLSIETANNSRTYLLTHSTFVFGSGVRLCILRRLQMAEKTSKDFAEKFLMFFLKFLILRKWKEKYFQVYSCQKYI